MGYKAFRKRFNKFGPSRGTSGNGRVGRHYNFNFNFKEKKEKGGGAGVFFST